jgi:hypothetical protein
MDGCKGQCGVFRETERKVNRKARNLMKVYNGYGWMSIIIF